ncbi:tetratricopeptide repeat protein [Asticcacaulis sp. ZE23SCel15]|uniref:tetratricopeptide repeat protein n=1 Tax=Asticcacaulis sp. ZE23SCel15 TaxID=3059027 RepID=UPI00265FC6AB|nr:tetratricopeptide repeat protein [Asticcacaulis sp. ZE23SCel15]WKL56351.1 tetratricopeptide repeat protein [Asticcacaulis sp. ZE23SCel15]
MSDIFEEAEEGLRTEKWTSIAKKSAPWVGGGLGLALLAALGVWGFTHMQSKDAAKASETYAAGLEALQSGDKVKAAKDFDETVKTGADAYEFMALTQLAAIALSDDKPADALAKLDEAAKVTGDPLLKDLASLKAAYIAFDEKAIFADLEKRLMPLTKDGRPYQALAKEALAMAKIQNGDLKGARADLETLAITLGTPDGVKERAQQAVQAIDSGAADLARKIVALPKPSDEQLREQVMKLQAMQQAQMQAQMQAQAAAQGQAPTPQ